MTPTNRRTAVLLLAHAAPLLVIGCDNSSSTAPPPAAAAQTASASTAATIDTKAGAPAAVTIVVDTQAAIAKVQEQLDKAVAFLKSQQKPDGGWQADEKQPPAITAIALKAIVAGKPDDAKADYVKKGYAKLLTYQVGDGGIYKDLLANYNTAIAVSALAEANDPAYKPQLDKAVAYLKSLQWTPDTRPEFIDPKEENTGKQVVKDDKDTFFGGWGYGGRSRSAGPDLSNAQLTIEALKEAGLTESDPAFQNAIKFVTRMQNNSETNDQTWAGDDGGFIYSPAGDRKGESMAGEYTDESGERRLRSYGSMSYAGLKSMIYAGLKKEDPRVKAAFGWVTKNWSLDENPGMRLNKPENAQQGLFYYYHTLAKALNAYDQAVITDAQGKAHDWRIELVDKLASLQKGDGSFVGEKKWMEDNAVLTTSYVVVALAEALEDLKQTAGK